MEKETVKHISRLARLNLTEEEVEKFSKEISEILKSFEILNKANVSGVEPSFHPIELGGAMREDSPEKCLPEEKALANAESKEEKFIKGPRAV